MGEVAIAVQEERNTHDHYAVAILEEDTCCSVGHLLREYFLIMSHLLQFF